MFHLSQGFISRRAALAGLLAIGLSVSAVAAQSPQASGLGQSWPNARDVSASPNWHVYVFERDGVRYVQVNDLNGTVRGAFATAQGQYLVLPVGTDAQLIGTPQRPLTMIKPAPSETVYRDASVQVLLTPQANGGVLLRVFDTATCTDPYNCGNVMHLLGH
ncbi:hypothetical protein [Dyella tabacisoli]|uniref:Uncharacterized protein n=1 Tax=Dyella tabacisoli TaxID=2282381 RepID=A0A369UQK8_9GAMM|nr:hypothetical protein [Dyella tabacisoli]RDD82747.1 hypothetical protein DVJ77_04295 [Dyella tabacisoli]